MIAEKIKALREARGWSQAELSRRLERLTTVDVTGLADRDVAVLAELAERLKNCKD